MKRLMRSGKPGETTEVGQIDENRRAVDACVVRPADRPGHCGRTDSRRLCQSVARHDRVPTRLFAGEWSRNVLRDSRRLSRRQAAARTSSWWWVNYRHHVWQDPTDLGENPADHCVRAARPRAHADIADRPFSFEQSAEDTAALLSISRSSRPTCWASATAVTSLFRSASDTECGAQVGHRVRWVQTRWALPAVLGVHEAGET